MSDKVIIYTGLSFGGIPVYINPHMPVDEMWLVVEGQKTSIHCHEGKHAGETTEEWIRRPQIHRIINLGDMTEIPKLPPPTFRTRILDIFGWSGSKPGK